MTELVSSDALIRLAGIAKTYQMGEVDVPVLRGVDLDIPQSRLTVLVGPSGSGKSTLLNIIGGMDQTSSGSVHFRQRDLARMNARQLTSYRREHVGVVFQFYNLVPTLTARENVLVATEISSNPMDPAEALVLVGLEDRLDHFPSQMSGGEQQRVAIARAIAKRPELLLCDEPTGALDFETGKRVLALLVQLQRDLGTTVLIITHNAAIAALADRVIRLRSGEIVERHDNEHPSSVEEVSW
ncbi:Macrolide export ATP-binding/permease protein MacB [Planctomycetes bacterium Pan216]|uniref:Macrolide export ATP-binding/permease protein MacB n=1 Tax=Kolteria novifilia TaxID=2527975 RepID=A0A518BCF2_9BACT|nr:Macrolide export ATP-binding/permease protein MacB [Planctomycetes bacterium Pan216]